MSDCKAIPGASDYVVCSNGQVKNKHTKRVLKSWSNGKDYQKVEFVTDSGKTRKYVHILVAEAFVSGKSSSKNEVHHKDGNRSNNKASNLSWTTRSENEDAKKETKEEKKEASEGMVDGGAGVGTVGVAGFRTVLGGTKKDKKGETNVTK